MFMNNTFYMLESLLTYNDNAVFIFRIILAAFLGILVGTERSRRLKGAGVRTHCILAMTAAVFMILSKYAFVDMNIGELEGVRGADPARIAAQVVSGISFLGTGIIFKQSKNSVHGLTTAAGMWATAAIGMSIGAGMYWVGIIEAFLLIMLQVVLHRQPFDSDIMTEQKMEVRFTGEAPIGEVIREMLKEHASLMDAGAISREGDTKVLSMTIRSHKPVTVEEIMLLTRDHPEIVGVNLREI